MGRENSSFNQEVDAIRYGMDLGMTLIDTAEMYHDAELVVGKALEGRRDDAYVVSKVLPNNASYKGTLGACEKSLKRLNIDCIDLYLLHWSGSHPIEETLEGFQALVDAGKIKNYGVSNLDVEEMEAAWAAPGGNNIITNQVLYNLDRRGIEFDLLPWCNKKHIPVMAYSPLNQGSMNSPALDKIAKRHGVSSYQIALAWVLAQENIIAIPKASKIDHLDQNRAAAEISLTSSDLDEIDASFPPPSRETPLEMI